jgi:hypothetical protein
VSVQIQPYCPNFVHLEEPNSSRWQKISSPICRISLKLFKIGTILVLMIVRPTNDRQPNSSLWIVSCTGKAKIKLVQTLCCGVSNKMHPSTLVHTCTVIHLRPWPCRALNEPRWVKLMFGFISLMSWTVLVKKNFLTIY